MIFNDSSVDHIELPQVTGAILLAPLVGDIQIASVDDNILLAPVVNAIEITLRVDAI